MRILTFCTVASLVLASGAATAQQRGTRDRAEDLRPAQQIEEAGKVVVDAGREADILKRFLDESRRKYADITSQIQSLQRDYDAAIEKAATPHLQRELTERYIKRRVEIIDVIVEDLDFVTEKIKEHAAQLNTFIGRFGEQSELIQKAQSAASDVSSQGRRIEDLQRQARLLIAQEPQRGTPEYLDWFNKQIHIRAQFRQEVNSLRRSLRSSTLYQRIGEGLRMSDEKAQQWQAYILEQTLKFVDSRADLHNEIEMSKEYLAYLRATENVRRFTEFGQFGEVMEGVVGIITGMDFPDFIFDPESLEPRPILLDSLSEIPKFDWRQYVEEHTGRRGSAPKE